MIRPKDEAEFERLRVGLTSYTYAQLPGVTADEARDSLAEQIVESERRKSYLRYVRDADIDAISADPTTPFFDPLRAAILAGRVGDLGQAFWMLFMFTHFGRHRYSHWYFAQEVYLGGGNPWTWDRVSSNPAGFRTWLDNNEARIKQRPGPRGFGNHRKRENLSGSSANGTGAVVESFVTWMQRQGARELELSHTALDDTGPSFDDLYLSMRDVHRFGRLARFDYLSTGTRVGLLTALPDRLYLADSSGPLLGARLLFGQKTATSASLDALATALANHLSIDCDTFEDALCNWQKSPAQFRSFRG